MLPNEPWFEVYKVASGVFAIYEPHQAEETISYLIVGTKQALLFDTGMGIGDIHKVVRQLTSRPIVVLNSHTHNDHVGGNSLFPFVFGMDTAFTRANAKGSRDDAQAEIAPGMICGELPRGFNPKTYATKPWHVSLWVHDTFKISLGHDHDIEIIARPATRPIRSRCSTIPTACSSPATPTIPAPSGYFARKQISTLTLHPSKSSPLSRHK